MVRAYFEFSRPFTLLPPAVGIITGAYAGATAARAEVGAYQLAAATLGAALLNVASNGLNQICDLPIDRINKPQRPLPRGELSLGAAGYFTAAAYTVSLLLAATVGPATFAVFAAGALLTVAYSAPPLRLRRHLIFSNVTISLTRGLLLKVAGWSVSAGLLSAEPWLLGSVFFLFLLGAASTKDFSDIEGDRREGCTTLPIKYGVVKSARIIAPFFIFPWLLFALFAAARLLSAHSVSALMIGSGLAGWGALIIRSILARPAALAENGENHPAWRQMYLLMIAAHIGTTVAYFI